MMEILTNGYTPWNFTNWYPKWCGFVKNVFPFSIMASVWVSMFNFRGVGLPKWVKKPPEINKNDWPWTLWDVEVGGSGYVPWIFVEASSKRVRIFFGVCPPSFKNNRGNGDCSGIQFYPSLRLFQMCGMYVLMLFPIVRYHTQMLHVWNI